MKNAMLRRMLCFVLALVLCAGMIPASYAEETENTEAVATAEVGLNGCDTPNEPHLFTTWNDGSGHMHSCEITEQSGYEMLFYFLTPDQEVISLGLNDLSATEGIQLSRVGSGAIWTYITKAGEGAVHYTYEGETYAFLLTGLERSTEVDLSQCDTPNEPHIFATWNSGMGHMHEHTLEPGGGNEVFFKFLTADGNVVDLEFQDLEKEGDVQFNVVGNGAIWIYMPGLGEGSVVYAPSESERYAYPVKSVLPSYGFYTEPERTADYYTTGFRGGIGETSTLYLMWEENEGAPNDLTAVLNDMQSTDAFEITVDKSAEDYWAVTFTNPDANCVILSVMNEVGNAYTRIWLWPQDYNNGSGGEYYDPDTRVTVPYGNQEVTVGMAWQTAYYVEIMELSTGMFGAWHETDGMVAFDMPVYLGALINADQDDVQPAPQEFYQQIMDTVEFQILECTNTDGSDSETQNLSMTEPYITRYAGIDTVAVRFQADNWHLFQGRVAMTFTYEGESYTVCSRIEYAEIRNNVEVAVSEEDDLNEILGSRDVLMAWLEENHPEEYERYMYYNGSGVLKLKLPPIAYQEVIYARAGYEQDSSYWEQGAIALVGTVDEDTQKRTSMPGMVAGGNVQAVGCIDFIANPECTVTYGDSEPFTCGLMADSGIVSGLRYHPTDLANVFDCTFQGFDYGVRSTPTGFVGNLMGSKFINCTYGMHVDGGEGGGMPVFRWNKFIGNTVAVKILAIPDWATYYDFRIEHSIFIHNVFDFHVPIAHRFFFYRNWYGHFPGRTAEFDESQAVSRSAQILDEDGTSGVLTNPHLLNWEDYTLEGYKPLGIDHTLESVILNSEAADLRISGDALAALTDSTDISVITDEGEEIAVWTFENTGTGDAGSGDTGNSGSDTSEPENIIVQNQVALLSGVTQNLPEGAIASSAGVSFSTSPYAYGNRSLFSGKQITRIGIPVKTVKALDENQIFTLSVVKTTSDAYEYTAQYALKLPLDQLGSSTTVNKWVYVDLTALNIQLAADETLAFGMPTDSVEWGYLKSANAAYAFRSATGSWSSLHSHSILFDVYAREVLTFEPGDLGYVSVQEKAVFPSVLQTFPEASIASGNNVEFTSPPYAYTVSKDVFSGKKITRIGIPVKKVAALDENQTFTLSVVKTDTSAYNYVSQHTLKLPLDQLGSSTTVNKWVYVDVSDLNIQVGEGETLAFGGKTDTVVWGWKSGYSDTTYRFRNAAQNWNGTTCGIFFDVYAEETLTYEEYQEQLRQEQERIEAEKKRQEQLEVLKKALSGKMVSILGDSISTFKGWSNNTDYNSTIGSNAVYYSGSNYITDVNETWWLQTINRTGTTLCVNNSWSGDTVTGRGIGRALELDNNADENPDIIAVYLGINDFRTKVTRENFAAGYDNMISGMLEKYPDAQVYLFTLVYTTNVYSGVNPDDLVYFNDAIEATAETYGCTLVDLYNDSGISKTTMSTYMGDGNLHPNYAGMDLITDCFLDVLLEEYVTE